MFNKILVALDAHETCAPLFAKALALAKLTGASLELITVISLDEDDKSPLRSERSLVGYPPTVDDSFWQLYQGRFDAYRRLGHQLLADYAKEAIAAGISTDIVQETGSPGKAICDRARASNADIVMVGSHGRQGLGELLMGSVSNYVVHHAPCSVLVIHEKEDSTLNYGDAAAAILLDVEGTLLPTSYAEKALSPFVRDNVELFLETRGKDADVNADLAQLRQEYENESETVPPWESVEEPIMAVPYIHDLLAFDRPSTALKSLEGKMWEAAYRSGQLKSMLFSDVVLALKRWHLAGKSIYIFSSVDVLVQELIFRHSEFGDLTPYISGYFDPSIGAKRKTESYRTIVEAMDPTHQLSLTPQKVLFISDDAAELHAARAAGCQTLCSNRSGNNADGTEAFTTIRDFRRV